MRSETGFQGFVRPTPQALTRWLLSLSLPLSRLTVMNAAPDYFGATGVLDREMIRRDVGVILASACIVLGTYTGRAAQHGGEEFDLVQRFINGDP